MMTFNTNKKKKKKKAGKSTDFKQVNLRKGENSREVKRNGETLGNRTGQGTKRSYGRKGAAISDCTISSAGGNKIKILSFCSYLRRIVQKSLQRGKEGEGRDEKTLERKGGH